MKELKFSNTNALVVSNDDINAMHTEAVNCLETVEKGTGAGNDFLGWVNLPSEISDSFLDDIQNTANRLRSECDVVVCIGIGGSYLGAKAVIEAMSNPFDQQATKVVFAGQNIGEDYMHDLMQYLSDKRFGIVVISKSGTTTEPAIAFRILKDMLVKRVGKDEAARYIVAVTDAKRGALRTEADREGYKTYVIPDNVG
ncbi:MAG: glucose-6-phosphate isomerase, partial [Muribaculaceae bacterium]|nr:glucose-6-phosphate isomerase [Muribaculaceae bacterium]